MNKTLKRFVFLVMFLAGLILNQFRIYAGPPFTTDDPEPVGFRHWEYYLSSMNLIQHGITTGTLPHAEINYGIIKNCQIHVLLPLNYNLIQHGDFQYGYSATEIGFKYRFYKNSDESLQIGTFPILEVPTFHNKYFANNLQVYLPVWVQKSWNRLTTYGGAGYWFDRGGNNTDWFFSGWEIQYDLSKTFTLGTEVFYRTSSTTEGRSSSGFNIGGSVNFNENLHFIFSAGHTITGEKGFMSYAGILITI
jgi:hypothetical protein